MNAPVVTSCRPRVMAGVGPDKRGGWEHVTPGQACNVWGYSAMPGFALPGVLVLLLFLVLACHDGPTRNESPTRQPLDGVWYGVADGVTASLEVPDLAFALELVQAGDTVSGRLGSSYRQWFLPISGSMSGQAVELDCDWCNCRFQGTLTGNNLSGLCNDDEGGAGSPWIAARAAPEGYDLAAAWSGTAFGRFPFRCPPGDYAFFLTTVPVGDSLFGAMDPSDANPGQVRIRGRIRADSVCFAAGGVEFSGVIADTILTGLWKWSEARTGARAEGAWAAHRIRRSELPTTTLQQIRPTGRER
jgi:hypothetical protein